jgi:hypothetical protein
MIIQDSWCLPHRRCHGRGKFGGEGDRGGGDRGGLGRRKVRGQQSRGNGTNTKECIYDVVSARTRMFDQYTDMCAHLDVYVCIDVEV